MEEENARKVQIGRVYRHYKGDYYIVEDIGRHSETGEEMVIYRALYCDGELWCRPLKLFLDCSPIHDPSLSGQKDLSDQDKLKSQKYRFELQEIASQRDK